MFLAYFLCMLSLLAAWVLMPLLPAILIYKRFPQTPLVVGGPLAGPLSKLTINTGGAFAAYFIVLLITTPLINQTSDAIRSATRPYWQVSGEIVLVDETGKEIKASLASDQVLEKMVVHTRPEILGHDGSALRFRIPETDDGLPAVLLTFPHPWIERRLEFRDPPAWYMFWKWAEPVQNRDNFNKTIKLGKIQVAQDKPARAYISLTPMDPPVATSPPSQ